MRNIQNTVLSYPKLKHWIEGRKESKNEKEKVLKNLRELATGGVSAPYIKGTRVLLDTLFPLLYDDLYLHDNGLDIKNIMEENYTVFVPNHQSHADYITLNYLIYKKYETPVHIAGGVNLNITLLGGVLRKLGCFFIKRSFANSVLYKLTLEAYLYYLLKNQRPIEFFFEGRRSRTGRLLPPRYGFYRMLTEVYSELSFKDDRKLLFIPVSISHEYVPDQKSFARELSGGKKRPETLSQVFSLVKLFAYRFGSLHISLGKPVTFLQRPQEDSHERAKELALQCFERVGKGIMITPASLLSLVLLDGMKESGLRWIDIMALSGKILEFCKNFSIPYWEGLEENTLKKSLENAMDIMVGNRVIEILKRKHSENSIFYSIKKRRRGDLVYLKNSISHHFLVPWLIAIGLENLTRGIIVTADDLEDFFLQYFAKLKREFFLPLKTQFFKTLLEVVSRCLKRDIGTFHEMFHLSSEEIDHLTTRVEGLSRLCRFLDEGHYLAAEGIKILGQCSPKGFSYTDYTEKAKKVFSREIAKRQLVHFEEAYSLPLLKSCMESFKEKGLIFYTQGIFRVPDLKGFDKIVQIYEKRLTLNSGIK